VIAGAKDFEALRASLKTPSTRAGRRALNEADKARREAKRLLDAAAWPTRWPRATVRPSLRSGRGV
jgi:hypothetical protein